MSILRGRAFLQRAALPCKLEFLVFQLPWQKPIVNYADSPFRRFPVATYCPLKATGLQLERSKWHYAADQRPGLLRRSLQSPSLDVAHLMNADIQDVSFHEGVYLMNRSFLYAFGLALTAYALAGPTVAQAGTVFFELDRANYGTPSSPAIAATPSQGTVTVNRTSLTTATVTFTANPYFLMSDVAINTLATVTVSNISGTLVVGSNTGFNVSPPGNTQMDGFGNFTVEVKSQTSSARYSQLSFDITNTSGTWTADNLVLAALGSPTSYSVAAHTYSYTNSTYTSQTGTGYAGDDGVVHFQEVPEPATVSLAGIGLVGMIGYALRRRRQKAAA